MRKSIESVVRGEIIVEGRKEIKVDKVEPRACSSLGTHINRSMCYDRWSIVRTKNIDIEEEYDRFVHGGLGDAEEDNLLSALLGGLSQELEKAAINRAFLY
jgi:hypothetical protein